MPNRSNRDERQATPKPAEKPKPVKDSATKDLSVLGASDKLRSRKSRIDAAIDEAS